MRLDKYLVSTGKFTRSEASRLAKSGRITVNSVTVKDSSLHIDENADRVFFDGEEIIYKKFVYVMLNKPAGYISATDDEKLKTVLELLPADLKKRGLFPCGRLDIDTEGLLILTDDGMAAHRLISPKHHAEKTYFFRCRNPITPRDKERLEGGVTLDDGYITLPCRVFDTDNEKLCGKITVTEGKFHQIKRMLEAVGNRVLYLERISFGNIPLDRTLARGEWRYLTNDEEVLLLTERK